MILKHDVKDTQTHNEYKKKSLSSNRRMHFSYRYPCKGTFNYGWQQDNILCNRGSHHIFHIIAIVCVCPLVSLKNTGLSQYEKTFLITELTPPGL